MINRVRLNFGCMCGLPPRLRTCSSNHHILPHPTGDMPSDQPRHSKHFWRWCGGSAAYEIGWSNGREKLQAVAESSAALFAEFALPV